VISDPYENDTEKNALLHFWRTQIDKLALKKISWDQLFSILPKDFFAHPDHPAVVASTSEEGNGLLHLAVYQNRDDLIPSLSEIPALRLRRNSFGLTPIELARYLDKKGSASLIHPTLPIQFKSQPNVEIATGGHDETLEELEYLAQPIYESEAVLSHILSRTKKAKSNDEIPPEKIWMGIYFDKEVQSGLHPKVTLRWIDDEIGFGVFASQRVPSCAFVGEYTGVVQERRKKHLKDNYYCVRYTTWEMGREKFVLDAEKKGNFTRFINHSSNPNLGLQSIYWRGLPRMVFISLREILEGEQLTFDYGTFFWKECRQIPKLF
jgi:hypothetical protein